jgi:hypothetical protein
LKRDFQAQTSDKHSSQDSHSLVNQHVLAGAGCVCRAAIREDALGTVDLFAQQCAENLGIDQTSSTLGHNLDARLPRPLSAWNGSESRARFIRLHSQAQQSRRSNAFAR